jgi:hypothetical protein
MTFALDKNPVCSMVHGSKLTGELGAKISPQGSGKINERFKWMGNCFHVFNQTSC